MNITELFTITLDLEYQSIRICDRRSGQYYPLPHDSKPLRRFILTVIKEQVDKNLDWIAER